MRVDRKTHLLRTSRFEQGKEKDAEVLTQQINTSEIIFVNKFHLVGKIFEQIVFYDIGTMYIRQRVVVYLNMWIKLYNIRT